MRNHVLLSLLAISIVGCGGAGADDAGGSRPEAQQRQSSDGAVDARPAPSDPELVRSAYLEYLDALARGDYEAACALMDDRLRDSVIEDAPVIQEQDSPPEKQDIDVSECPGAMEVVADYAIADDLEPVKRDVETAEIAIDGSEAIIHTTVGPYHSVVAWDGIQWLALDGASAD